MSNRYMGRTLAPAQFESFMDYCDSLKNGKNDAEIDRVKYECAVSEGYIVPRSAQKKPKMEGVFSLGDVEKAIQGTVAAFLPHLDDEEQGILGGFLKVMDDAVNTGDTSALKDMAGNIFRQAGQGEVFDDAMAGMGADDDDDYDDAGYEDADGDAPAEEDDAPVPPPADDEYQAAPAEEDDEAEVKDPNEGEPDEGCASKAPKKKCKDGKCEDGDCDCKDGKCKNKANGKKPKDECGENCQDECCCGDKFRV